MNNNTFYQNTEKLYNEGYGKRILETLTDYADASPVGFRLGGTPQEHRASDFIYEEMKKAGLDTRKEAIPVDSFELKGGRIIVDGDIPALDGKTIPLRVYQGSQIAGYRGSEGEIIAKCIYVRKGLTADYEHISKDKDYFKGKILIIDGCFDNIWVGWQMTEATRRGALAVIMTIDNDNNEGTYLKYSPTALVGQDGEAPSDCIPLVYICERDGKELKDIVKNNPDKEITFISEVNFVSEYEGGIGYNVIAEIPGRKPGKVIMLGAHQDCHLKAGADDTGAVATIMTIAKAMAMTGYEPEATIRFLFTSSEEYGKVNTVYDWQHGATEAMIMHPEWADETVAFLNYEVMPEKGGTPMFRGVPELTAVIEKCRERMSRNMYPSQINIESMLLSIADDWVITANGIPSLSITSMRAEDYFGRYHTTEDRIENIDYDAMRQIANASFDIIREYDNGLIDYNLSGRVDDFASMYAMPEITTIENGFMMGTSREEFSNIDIDDAFQIKLDAAFEKWSDAVNAYNVRKNGIKDMDTVNTKLIAYNRFILKNLTAAGIGQTTIYPYIQTLTDAVALKMSAEALAKDEPVKSEILEAFDKVNLDIFGWIPLTCFVNWVSVETCRKMAKLYGPMERTWGYYAKLSPIIDIFSEYVEVRDDETPDYNKILVKINKLYKETCRELERRLGDIAEVLDTAAEMLDEIR